MRQTRKPSLWGFLVLGFGAAGAYFSWVGLTFYFG